MKTCRAALIAAVVLVAWSPAAQGVDFGFEVGMCWATQDFACPGPYEYETDFRLGPRLGLFAEFGLTPRLSLQTGIHFVAMGMNYDWEIYTVENKIEYVAIPILVRARLESPPSELSLCFSAGPRVDILIAKDPDPWFESIYDDLAKAGLGADVGVGIESGAARLEFRYSATFTDSHPDDSLLDITNRAYSLVYSLALTRRPGSPD